MNTPEVDAKSRLNAAAQCQVRPVVCPADARPDMSRRSLLLVKVEKGPWIHALPYRSEASAIPLAQGTVSPKRDSTRGTSP